MIEAAALVAKAREWIGIPFLHQGRNRFGVDCVGFVACVMAELGVSVLLDEVPRDYARNPQDLFSGGLVAHSREIKLQPAVLIMIKFPFATFTSHCAIYTGSSMIHCHEMEGRVIEHGYQEPWIARTKGFWALPMVTYQ